MSEDSKKDVVIPGSPTDGTGRVEGKIAALKEYRNGSDERERYEKLLQEGVAAAGGRDEVEREFRYIQKKIEAHYYKKLRHVR